MEIWECGHDFDMISKIDAGFGIRDPKKICLPVLINSNLQLFCNLNSYFSDMLHIIHF